MAPVEIQSRIKRNGMFADEAATGRVVIPCTVVVEIGLRVELAGGVLEGIRQRTSRICRFAERVERIGLGESARCVREQYDRTGRIRMTGAE